MPTLHEAAAEIERLRFELEEYCNPHVRDRFKAQDAEIERLRSELAESKAAHAHLMESYQALGRECFEKQHAAAIRTLPTKE